MATAIASNVETVEVENVSQSAYAILCDLNADSRSPGLVQERTETKATTESRTMRRETLSVATLKAPSLARSFPSTCQGTPVSGSAVASGASFLASSRVAK